MYARCQNLRMDVLTTSLGDEFYWTNDSTCLEITNAAGQLRLRSPTSRNSCDFLGASIQVGNLFGCFNRVHFPNQMGEAKKQLISEI